MTCERPEMRVIHFIIAHIFLSFSSTLRAYDSRYYGSQGRTVGIVEPQPASAASNKPDASAQEHEALSSQHQVRAYDVLEVIL